MFFIHLFSFFVIFCVFLRITWSFYFSDFFTLTLFDTPLCVFVLSLLIKFWSFRVSWIVPQRSGVWLVRSGRRSQLGEDLYSVLWADWGRGNSPWWSVNSSWGTWSIFSLGWYLMMLAVYLCQNTELFLVVLNSVWAGWTGSFHTIPQCHDEPSGPRRWCSEILTAGSCRRSRTLTLYTECAEPSRVWARLRMDHTDARTKKMWGMKAAEGPTWRNNRQTDWRCSAAACTL